LLDEVERDGNSVLVIRYGRPSALLSPVGDELAVRRPIPAPKEYVEEITGLTEVERKLLLTLGDGEWHPDPVHNVCWVTEGLLALSKLELKHLAARGGLVATPSPVWGPRWPGPWWLTQPGPRSFPKRTAEARVAPGMPLPWVTVR
jgi:hypothetical protein